MTKDQSVAPAPVFFNKDMARAYDEKNSRLATIATNMHFLIRLVLEELPSRARILCPGVGTGAEILSLAEAYPDWSFVGIDPSAEMLEVCRDKLEAAGILERCELIHGFVQDASEGAEFDAVVSVLVAHFIAREDRPAFYRASHDRLKPGGYFVSTEICFDLDSPAFPPMLKNWERVQQLSGADSEALRTIPDTLRNTLCVLSPAETEEMLTEAGFETPVPFFQSFLIRGFHATK